MRLIHLITLITLPLALLADEVIHPVTECHEYLATPEEIPQRNSFDTPYKKGMLWKAEKDNKINYVFGTIHSQDYLVTGFPPPVRLALVKSNLLLMETVPGEQANQAFFDAMYYNDERTMTEFLSPEMLEELTRIAIDYGVPEEKVIKLKPWAAFSLIGRPKPVRAPSQEMNLLKLGMQTIQRIESLETMPQIITSLESISEQDQVTILEDTICNHSNIIRDAKKVVDLYAARDLAGILEFNQQSNYQ